MHQLVGFGQASRLCQEHLTEENARVASLRERLWAGLQHTIPRVALNGHPHQRVPGNLHVSFDGIHSEALLSLLQPVLAASTRSACTSLEGRPSHVLRAMGLGPRRIDSSVRFGLGRFTTAQEIDTAIDAVALAVHRLRHVASGDLA